MNHLSYGATLAFFQDCIIIIFSSTFNKTSWLNFYSPPFEACTGALIIICHLCDESFSSVFLKYPQLFVASAFQNVSDIPATFHVASNTHGIIVATTRVILLRACALIIFAL